MSENEFFNRMNRSTAARVAAQRELEEIRRANLRKQEEKRKALVAKAEGVNRATHKANRRRAMLRTLRRLIAWSAVIILLAFCLLVLRGGGA